MHISEGVVSGPVLAVGWALTAAGTALGKIKVPQVVANLTFGGPKRNRLFITGTTSLYAVYVGQVGAQRP